MEILIWLIIAYGQSNIMVYGSIFNGVRNKIKNWGENPYYPLPGIGKFISELLSCMMCTSTWVGFFLSLVFYSPSHELLNTSNYFSWFFDGMLASGFVWAINAVVEWYEENRPSNNHNNF